MTLALTTIAFLAIGPQVPDLGLWPTATLMLLMVVYLAYCVWVYFIFPRRQGDK